MPTKRKNRSERVWIQQQQQQNIIKVWWSNFAVASSANLCVSIRYQPIHCSQRDTHSKTQDKIGFSRIGTSMVQWMQAKSKREYLFDKWNQYLCAKKSFIQMIKGEQKVN